MVPENEAQTQKPTSAVSALIALLALGAGAWWYFGGGLEKQAATEMRRIESQVAADAVEQYQIAKRNGSAMDACVQAGLVTAAYLQAKDEVNYQKWKKIEEADCAEAGVSR